MTYTILPDNEALDLIYESLKGSRGEDQEGDWYHPPLITVREEKMRDVRVVHSYSPLANDLTFGLVKIIAAVRNEGASEWNGEIEYMIVFKMSSGHYGLTLYSNRWDATFYSEISRLEISESCDWSMFYNFVLTDRDRDIVNIFMNPCLGLTSPQADERELAKLVCEYNFIWIN